MQVFETEDFRCGGAGGGDFALPGALNFQHLHSDGAAAQSGQYKDVKLATRAADGSTFWCELGAQELPGCSYRVVNYRDLPVSERQREAERGLSIETNHSLPHSPLHLSAIAASRVSE